MLRQLVAAGALIVVATLTPVAAHAYGEPSGPTTVTVGTSTTLTLQNLPSEYDDEPDGILVSVDGPGDAVLAGLVTRAYTSSSGAVSISISFPTAGSYTVGISNNPSAPVSGAPAFSDSFTMTAEAAAAPGDSLPETGVNLVPFLWFGGGLVLLGFALVVMLAVVRSSRERETIDA